MVDALALSTGIEKVGGFLYLWTPGRQPKQFKKSMYVLEFYADNDRYCFSEDLMFLEHFDVRTKKSSIDYGDRGFTAYGYYDFTRCHGEICQLMASLDSPKKWFRQLTKNGQQCVDNKFLSVRVDNDAYNLIVDKDNNLYVAQSNNLISKISTKYEDGIIKDAEKTSIMKRSDEVSLALFKDKVYDFSKNVIRDTDTGEDVFKADANICSLNGIDALLCSTAKGDVFDCTSGKKIYTNDNKRFSRLVKYNDEILIYDTKQIKRLDGQVMFEASQLNLDAFILKIIPVSGDWLFD